MGHVMKKIRHGSLTDEIRESKRSHRVHAEPVGRNDEGDLEAKRAQPYARRPSHCRPYNMFNEDRRMAK